jgi:hypothetical protein
MITAQKGMQQKVLESKADFILMGACRGGGMTTAMLLHAKKNARKAGFYGEYWEDFDISKWTRDYAVQVIDNATYRMSNMRFYFDNRSRFSFKKDHDKTPDCIYIEDISKKPEDFLAAWDYDKIVASCHVDRESWLGSWMKEQKLYECDELVYIYVDNDLFKTEASNCKGLLMEHVNDIGGDVNRIKSFQYITSDLCENKALLESDPSYLSSIATGSDEDRKKSLGGSWE